MKSKCFTFNYRMFVVFSLIIVCVAAAAITGCASKGVMPLKSLSDAEMAIKLAKENSATVNAPLDIRIAEEKLQKAREAAKREDFISAERLADEATMDARVAEVKSQTKKVKQMENDLRDSIETLQNEVNRNQQRY